MAKNCALYVAKICVLSVAEICALYITIYKGICEESSEEQKDSIMDLIGIKVNHVAWGLGTVTKCDGQFIAVEFAIGVKHFLYPSAFEKFLRAEDADVQSSIIKAIEAEQKRQAEE